MSTTAVATACWVETWSRAWPVGDVDAVAALYAADAVFSSHPFRATESPAGYAAWAFAEQQRAECRFGAPVVAGDRATVAWWAVVTSRDGREETLAGASLLQFGPGGLVVEQRDVWAGEPGRQALHGWAADGDAPGT